MQWAVWGHEEGEQSASRHGGGAIHVAAVARVGKRSVCKGAAVFATHLQPFVLLRLAM